MASPFVTGKGMSHFPNGQSMAMLDMYGGPGRAPKRIQIDTMHKVLIGGDQLTVARMKGAKSMHEVSQHDAGRLDGFIPVVEDWHTKVCLLEVRLFHVAMMILSV